MKALLVLSLLVPAFAFANLCERYNSTPAKLDALAVVVAVHARTMDEICNSPRILDIEIQPSQIIIDGEAVPHWAVFLHYNEESCKYMVRRQGLELTSRRCFPTW